MSRKRQSRDGSEDGLLVRTYAVTHPGKGGLEFPTRSVDWDQLAYASRGVMSVRTAQGTWVVPPHRAVWIPAGVAHQVELSGKVSIRTLFFVRGLARALPRRCQAVNVPPLLRELILATIRRGLLHRGVASQARLARVILDQLEVLPAVPLQLPMPREARARRAAELLQARPGEAAPLVQVARAAGASKRTLERLFRMETHMTLGRWRQRLRLIEALRLLAAGHSVTRVALDVGYNSPSAFISAFRRHLGTTPARYFDLQAP
jgi:AraC-like DNA-binding protein